MSKAPPPLINADSSVARNSIAFFRIDDSKHVGGLKVHPTPAYLRRQQKFRRYSGLRGCQQITESTCSAG